MMQSMKTNSREEIKTEEEFMTAMYETTIQELAEEVQKWKQNYSQAVYAMREEKDALTEMIREKNMEIRMLTEELRKMSTRLDDLKQYENPTDADSADCVIDLYV
jgi:uncharacterized coiled-coil DUF342 family protein